MVIGKFRNWTGCQSTSKFQVLGLGEQINTLKKVSSCVALQFPSKSKHWFDSRMGKRFRKQRFLIQCLESGNSTEWQRWKKSQKFKTSDNRLEVQPPVWSRVRAGHSVRCWKPSNLHKLSGQPIPITDYPNSEKGFLLGVRTFHFNFGSLCWSELAF